MEGRYVILPSPDLAPHLDPDIQSEFKQVVVRDGAELEAILSRGYEGWRNYRDQLLSRNPE